MKQSGKVHKHQVGKQLIRQDFVKEEIVRT